MGIANIFYNNNFELLNTFSVFEVIALVLATYSILIAYFLKVDSTDLETVDIFKAIKYVIPCLFSFITFILVITFSYFKIDNGVQNDCIAVNVLKLYLFCSIGTLILFLGKEIFIDLVKGKRFSKINL